MVQVNLGLTYSGAEPKASGRWNAFGGARIGQAIFQFPRSGDLARCFASLAKIAKPSASSAARSRLAPADPRTYHELAGLFDRKSAIWMPVGAPRRVPRNAGHAGSTRSGDHVRKKWRTLPQHRCVCQVA